MFELSWPPASRSCSGVNFLCRCGLAMVNNPEKIKNGWAVGPMHCQKCTKTFEGVRILYSDYLVEGGEWPSCCGELAQLSHGWRMDGAAYPDCWVFDENHRVYDRDAKGREMGAPIWIHHWVRAVIVGETSRSWITRRYGKVPKKGGRGYAFCKEHISRMAFVEKGRWPIAEMVRSCNDYEKLKMVANIVGYKDS